MNFLPLAAASAIVAAVPASGEVRHQISVELEGGPVSVSYEPRTRTSLKQRGLGPRTMETCAWKTSVRVARIVAGADGRPIEALTRDLGEVTSFTGEVPGYCHHVRARHTAPFGGDRDGLRSVLAEIAEHDAGNLRTELASIGSVRRSSR